MVGRPTTMVSLALCLFTLSATPRVGVQPVPIFVVLKTGATAAAARREARLFDEVSLLLDNFAVITMATDDAQFASRSLAEQLKSVLELATRNDAVGVLWLAEPVKGQLMVYVVGIGTGRSLIRTIEFDQRTGSERALALIVRELLGTAFLQASPESIDPQLAEVVRSVRRELPKDPLLDKPVRVEAPTRPVVEARPWVVSGSVLTSVALAGGQNRWLSAGLQLRAERALTERFFVGLSAELLMARDLDPAAQVSSLELPFGATAGWQLAAGPFTLVPRLSVLAGFNRLWAQSAAAGSTVGSVWSLRGRVGFGLRTTGGPVALQLELSVDAVPVGGLVREVTTGAEVWKSPWLEANVAAGVVWKG